MITSVSWGAILSVADLYNQQSLNLTIVDGLVPNIEDYGKIYQQSENIKNLNKLNMFASKKGRKIFIIL